MARAISVALKAHLGREVTTLATCWKITRTDGTIFRFTDHDVALTVSGDVYTAAFYSRSAIASNATMSVDNLDLTGIFDSDELTVDDLRSGLFDFAQIEIFAVNWSDLTQGILKLQRGYLGEVSTTPSGTFHAELRGLTQMLANSMGELYTASCKALLGDARCKVPIEPSVVARSFAYAAGVNPDFIRVDFGGFTDSRRYSDVIYQCTTAGTTAGSAPTYTTTPGDIITDGTAAFTCVTAWTRAGVVSAVTDNELFNISLTEPRAVGLWFDEGVLHWETGLNAARSMEVRGWDPGTSSLRLFVPMPRTIAIGDRFRIAPGCDKLLATCRDKFANINNMRATPFIPGNDVMLRVPIQ